MKFTGGIKLRHVPIWGENPLREKEEKSHEELPGPKKHRGSQQKGPYTNAGKKPERTSRNVTNQGTEGRGT